LPRLLGELEPDRATGFFGAPSRGQACSHSAPRHRLEPRSHRSPQLAVDGKVEEREITRAPSHLQLGPDRPEVAKLGRSGGLAPMSFALFQGGRRTGLPVG
jgi:hypothetical protein